MSKSKSRTVVDELGVTFYRDDIEMTHLGAYHGDVCQVCHHLIRVQIFRGTGVCCGRCEERRDDQD